MNTKYRRIRYFFVSINILWVVVFPICLHYNNFTEIDPFSPIAVFEIVDQEDILSQEEIKAKIFPLSLSHAFSPFRFSFMGPFLSFPFLTSIIDLPISILRC
jgi:hypothetical protein